MTRQLEHPVVHDVAGDLDAELIAFRRDLHRWPERSGDERRTAAMVAAALRGAGLSVRTGVGGHGVVALLDGAVAGPTVAYRAELDAIAATEPAGDFSSRVPGVAHLCGHDLHTVIGVGIARVLARRRHRLPGRVVFVFQPAEETLGGARPMLTDGMLSRAAPQEIYALHCGPLPVGTFGVMPGQPGLDTGLITVPGPRAPERAERVVAAIGALSTLARPRTARGFARVVDDLMTAGGPLTRFVVAEARAERGAGGGMQVRLWLRAWPDGRYPELRDEVRRVAERHAPARAWFPRPPFPALICSPGLNRAVAAHLSGVAAVRVLHSAYPFQGDDFALFLRRIPGAMIVLGVADPRTRGHGVPHLPGFAPDERAIGLGVRAMAGLLWRRLEARGR